MSRGINKVILIGNVGKAPDVRTMPNGKSVTNLSLATSESWKDKTTGQQQDRTEWHRIVFYERLAEIVGQYVQSGSKIYIEGSLRTRKYEKGGVDHYTTEIVASEMQLLDSRSTENKVPARAAPPVQAPARGLVPLPVGDIFDDGGDDIPF